MQTAEIKLYSPGYGELKTYLLASLFVVGNIIMPQLIHLIPGGGLVWLPIYFFTLVGAYKYGTKVGLLTAVASPVVNSLLFGMPALAMVGVIMMKSVVLALVAGVMAARFQKATLLHLLLVVVAYQILGGLGEWALTGSLSSALRDFRIGFPGMLLQIFGGWAVINYLIKN